MRDKLFEANIDIADFRFDKGVVEVFDDMVRRSVPGYDSMIQMIGLIARMYGQDNTNYYDLGSSTGAISLAIALNNKNQNNQFFAIDNSEEMVKKCQQNLERKIDNLHAICADINEINIQNASIVVLNLTLQFIDVKERSNLIRKIYKGLNPGGVLIISEKIHFEDKETQDQITNLHIDFKKENGYSELEIAINVKLLKMFLSLIQNQYILNASKNVVLKTLAASFSALTLFLFYL